MKKLLFSTLMCVAAMSAKAQVLTSETINGVYKELINSTKSDYAYNAEMTGNDITTMYVYKVVAGAKGMQTLKQHMKHEYAYAADGTLTSKVTYLWNDDLNDWTCSTRYDYALDNGKYSVEYSRYNHVANRFDLPVDKITYDIMPYDSASNVSCYHRKSQSSQYQLISVMRVMDLPILYAKK